MTLKKLLVLSIVIIGLGAWWFFDLGSYLQLDRLQAGVAQLKEYRESQPLAAGLMYFAIYLMVTALSLPGAAIMTLAGGALFGFWYALLLASFASSLGATAAFMVSRILLRDWVQKRFARQLDSVNKGFERDGPFYLFTLRLVPVFPFFVINLLMGLLPISVWRFYWVSQIGMLAGTAVYVNAGTQLGELRSLQGILSLELLGSFVLLGLFPWLARSLIRAWQRRRSLAGFKRPRKFDDNLLVIGAGSGGLVAALIAATVRAKVSLVERDRMGGDCLNTGCVPSKAFIRSARMAEYRRRSVEFGLVASPPQVQFDKVMERVQSVIRTIEPHDSVERFTGLGVNCIQGEARIVSPWEVEIDGERRSARNIIVATGGRPRVPDIPGLDAISYYTSDTVWELREAPQHLLVLGGGPIGCELAQAFARLDVAVTLAMQGERLLPREDEEVSAAALAGLQASGVRVLTAFSPREFIQTGEGGIALAGDASGETITLAFSHLLLAVGRQANVEGLGLEAIGAGLNEQGSLSVDEYLRTDVPTIFACGDVAGPHLFTHMASHQAWYATVNALFGSFRKFRVDYSVVPHATFIDPEVARVGLNEREARAQGLEYEVTRYELSDLDRAIADGEAKGFVKVLTPPGKDRILGATIVGYHAAELLPEFVLAMKHGLGLGKVLGTIHVYPTLGEANRFVASEWRKARKPEGLLDWVGRYHRWRR